MPTYEYACRACGHEFELFQQMSDPVKRKCPKCAKLRLQRLFGTGAGVLFKGGGFYETDYRSESYRKAADAEKKSSEPEKKPDAKESKAASNGKSEAKPASSRDSTKKSTAKERNERNRA